MKILICFDLPVGDRGTINGHAIHEVTSLTESELKRVCDDQRTLIQKQLARSAQVQQRPVPVSNELILLSVCRLDDESLLHLPR